MKTICLARVAALAPLLVVLGCASQVNDGSGGAGASGSGTGSSQGGSAPNASGVTSSNATGGGPCTSGQESCDGGVHEACVNGSFVSQPCPTGFGCSPTSPTCAACTCTPGTKLCVDTMTAGVCDQTCVSSTTTPCDPGSLCIGTDCTPAVCVPGTIQCLNDQTPQICNAAGSGFDPGTPCGPKEQCVTGNGCESLCKVYASSPSSVGCSFFALNMDNFDEGNPDAVVIGNTSSTLTAIVNFYSSYGGTEALLQSNVSVPPLSEYTLTIPNGAGDVIHGISQLRVGGSFRVESDIPIIAYQHSPLTPYFTNDASCLLPEPSLGTHYFVPSYYDALGATGEPHPSYFDVVATTNNTMVTIKVPQATASGTGVGALSAGGSETVMMNRYDTLQVVNANSGAYAARDLTGAEVVASAPVALFGAVECAQVPAGMTFCDHMEEQAIPTRTWGKTYVGAHVPKRSNTERYYWRVIGGQNGTQIDASPPQPGFPVTVDAGQFFEFYGQADATAAGGSFVLTGNKPFSAVQYMTGQDAFGAGTGDPSMILAVPVEQFLSRYVILTPSGYSVDYVQIIRKTADDVTVDGTVVPAASYYTIGAYTVADYPVAAGPHVILSTSPFGIVGAGYTGATSYGYPGGLALNNIAPN